MARRTISLPDAIEARIRTLTKEGESFSGAITRLIEAGIKTARGRNIPSYVASGEGPEDLGRRAETYLRELVSGR